MLHSDIPIPFFYANRSSYQNAYADWCYGLEIRLSLYCFDGAVFASQLDIQGHTIIELLTTKFATKELVGDDVLPVSSWVPRS